jgi:hypothetical protein
LTSLNERMIARRQKSPHRVAALSCLPCEPATKQLLSSGSEAQLPSQIRSFCVPATCAPPVLSMTHTRPASPGLLTVAEVSCMLTAAGAAAAAKRNQQRDAGGAHPNRHRGPIHLFKIAAPPQSTQGEG